MSQYAKNTSVPADRSRGEIERILTRYGADAFSYGWEGHRAIVAFRCHGRMVKFTIPMPTVEEHMRTETGRQRTRSSAEQAREQASRQRWRALALVVKAKLEAVESGIETFDEAFLAHILLPNGETVGQWTEPQVALAYEQGTMPKMLPVGSE